MSSLAPSAVMVPLLTNPPSLLGCGRPLWMAPWPYLEDKLTEVSWRMEMIREVRRFVSIIPSWILTERNYIVRLLQYVSGIVSEFE